MAPRAAVRLDDGVGPGWAYVPQYYEGGAVMRLFGLGAPTMHVPVRVRALALA